MLKKNIAFHFYHFLSIVGEDGQERCRPNMTHCRQATYNKQLTCWTAMEHSQISFSVLQNRKSWQYTTLLVLSQPQSLLKFS